MKAEASDSLVGFTLIDKYKVLRPIGRGGMGEVYEAQHVELGKRVAVKVMLGKYAEDNEAIARFKREALAASRIGNPHIIDVSDIGRTQDGRSFVVMEYLQGQPLSAVIEGSRGMPAWRAVDVMRQVLRAVHAAHSKGIIHRDLKPDNIFLVEQDEQRDFVKLLDFGISKIVDMDVDSTKLTSTGVVMGTPLYMAPEQAMGNATDVAADIYALGVILYEMLAGRPPFEGPTYAVLVAKLLTSDPEPLDKLRTDLPPALVRAVHRALEKEPERRFPSAEAFAAAISGDRTRANSSGGSLAGPPAHMGLAETIDSGKQVAIPAPSSLGKRPTKKKPIWPWLAAGALVAGAGVGLALAMTTGGHDAPQAQAQTPAPTVTPIPPPSVPTGMLSVKSVPDGATVLIDGEKKGTTPLEIRISAGQHQLHVEHDGFASIDQREDINANERSSERVVLAKIESSKAVFPGPGPNDPGKVVKTPPVNKVKTPPPPIVTAPPPVVVAPPPVVQKPPERPIEKPIERPVEPPKNPPSDVRKPNPYQ